MLRAHNKLKNHRVNTLVTQKARTMITWLIWMMVMKMRIKVRHLQVLKNGNWIRQPLVL